MLLLRRSLVLLLVICGAACQQQSSEETATGDHTNIEATSLLGKPLQPMTFSEERQKELDADLAAAKAKYDANPNNLDDIIWYGRRTAYLSRYRGAISIYSAGLEKYPESAELLRHRGHRYISVREFDKAVADLQRAAELTAGKQDIIEPDGQPNEQNRPRSTLKSNIWYHLGLAHYLRHDFEAALQAYLECMKYSTWNDDMLVATSDWLYMTYRRLGREDEAAGVLDAISEDMEIVENFSYHRRLLMYKGLLTPHQLLDDENTDDLELATQGYGVANWYYYNGNRTKAIEIFKKTVAGSYWPAFGYIAAEVELANLGES